MHDPILYLSKDKAYLMDDKGANMYSMFQDDEQVYYRYITIESDAFEKVCTGSTSVKICTAWNEAHECLAFENVSICTQWKLLPKGFGNIS